MLNATPAKAMKTADSPRSGPRPRTDPIDRTFHGLLVTGILDDLRTGAPHTIIAPTNAAFDDLPWAFEDLLSDPALVDARFDLFEGLVVSGDFEEGEAESLAGEGIRIEAGVVTGPHGAGRILRSFVTDNLRVHVVDSCVLPWDPDEVVDAASEVCEAQLC